MILSTEVHENLVVQLGKLYLKTGTIGTKSALVVVPHPEDAWRGSISDLEGAITMAKDCGGIVRRVKITVEVSEVEVEGAVI